MGNRPSSWDRGGLGWWENSRDMGSTFRLVLDYGGRMHWRGMAWHDIVCGRIELMVIDDDDG